MTGRGRQVAAMGVVMAVAMAGCSLPSFSKVTATPTADILAVVHQAVATALAERATATPAPTPDITSAVRNGVATALVAQIIAENSIRKSQATPTPRRPANTALEFTSASSKMLSGGTIYQGVLRNRDSYWIAVDIDVVIDFTGEDGSIVLQEHGKTDGMAQLGPGDEEGWSYVLVPGKATNAPLLSPHVSFRWQAPPGD